MITIRKVLAAGLHGAVALLLVSPVIAQDYPSRPIRFIVPNAPGGGSDILARLYGQRMSETMGQRLIVDNRVGAGGVIGAEILAKSQPDGYTLMLADMNHTINPAVYGKLPYDPLNDFTAITLVARLTQWLFVHSDVQTNNVVELIAIARKQPDHLKIGSAGNGSGTHLLAELFMRSAGVKLTHVPYKGTGPALSATAAGETNLVFASLATAGPFMQSGKLRPVAVGTAKRHPSRPEVPTFEESGVPDMVVPHWFGVLAPAGLSGAIRTKLHRELAEAANHPSVAERYKTLVIEPAISTPEEFRTLIESDLRRWGRLVRDANIRAQ